MAPLMWKFDTVIFDCGVIGAVSFCIFLAALFVSSLYFGVSNKTRYMESLPESLPDEASPTARLSLRR